MREQTSLIRSFESDDEESVVEYASDVEQTFIIPERNWNGLIDSYNSANKKKFQFTPLECKKLVEYAKRSVPPLNIFEAMGTSPFKYKKLKAESDNMENALDELTDKPFLTEKETDCFHGLLRHPLRVLMSDIERAVGISKVMDWDAFEQNVKRYPEVQLAKMKARFKDFFNEKESQTATNVTQILVSGNWVSKI